MDNDRLIGAGKKMAGSVLAALLLSLALTGCIAYPEDGYGQVGYGDQGWSDRHHVEFNSDQEPYHNWGR